MREQTPLLFLALATALSAQDPLPTHARLEGEVLTPTLEPADNAQIEVELDGIVVARARSDGQGVFVIPKVPQGFVVVRATTDAPDIGALVVDLLGESRGFVTVLLRPARVVHGTVRDELGNPVPDAVVLSSPSGISPLAYSTCSARSDRSGAYRLSHVPMGPVRIRAWAPTFAAFAGETNGTGDTTLDCTLAHDPCESTFVLDGVPPDYRSVELHVRAGNEYDPVPLPAELARPRQVEPGRWVVTGWLEQDELRAHLVAPGLTTYPAELAVLAGIGSTTRRFVSADEDGRIRGRVVDAEGTGVANLPLVVQPTEGEPGNALRRLVTTSADGTFIVQSPVGTSASFAIRSLSHTTVLAGNNSNPVWFVAVHEAGKQWEMRSAEGHRVTMRLRDGGGTPAAGVQVALFSIDDRVRPIGTATSGLDGSASVDSLMLQGITNLRVEATGHRGVARVELKASAGRVTDFGIVALAQPATVLVLARSAPDTPLAGYPVYCMQMGSDTARSAILITDREGRARWSGLMTGNYWFGPFTQGTGQGRTLQTGDEVDVTVTASPR